MIRHPFSHSFNKYQVGVCKTQHWGRQQRIKEGETTGPTPALRDLQSRWADREDGAGRRFLREGLSEDRFQLRP